MEIVFQIVFENIGAGCRVYYTVVNRSINQIQIEFCPGVLYFSTNVCSNFSLSFLSLFDIIILKLNQCFKCLNSTAYQCFIHLSL